MSQVAPFAARTMDRIFRHEGVIQVNIWAIGMIESEGGAVRAVKLSLQISDKRHIPHIDSLSHLATTDPNRYLSLCSYRWIRNKEIPGIIVGGLKQ